VGFCPGSTPKEFGVVRGSLSRTAWLAYSIWHGCSHDFVGRLSCCEVTAPAGPATGRWLQDFLKRASKRLKPGQSNPILCGYHSLPFNTWRVAPQIFQAVEGPFVTMKDMDYYLQVIEHHPLARGKSINRCCSNLMVCL
jgi:hypothetical protein